mgnify:CR=1 FL=1
MGSKKIIFDVLSCWVRLWSDDAFSYGDVMIAFYETRLDIRFCHCANFLKLQR